MYFSVTGGTATIRLVWGDSDAPGSTTPENAWMYYEIKLGMTMLYSGTRTSDTPGWTGVDDFTVSVSPTPYSIRVWWDDGTEEDDNTVFRLIDTPGQLEIYRY